MTAASEYAELLKMRTPVVSTQDAAIRWRKSVPAATMTLKRLEEAGLMRRITSGLWSLQARIDPLVLPPFLTRPFPSYVSLQSALYLHGMIEQIPHVIYVASLAKTRVLKTTVATFSIHQLSPDFFGGFATSEHGAPIAMPEKALLDVLYLSSSRTRLFTNLPELSMARRFDVRQAVAWIGRIRDPSRRTMVRRRFEQLLVRDDEGR